jgi:hypothetical protein
MHAYSLFGETCSMTFRRAVVMTASIHQKSVLKIFAQRRALVTERQVFSFWFAFIYLAFNKFKAALLSYKL